MEERQVIYISSVDREKVGISTTHDFKIKLGKTYKLDTDKKHEIAVDTVMMTYSWHNISANNNNNQLNILLMLEQTGKQLLLLMVCIVMKT